LKYSFYSQPQGHMLFKVLDAETNTNLTNAQILVRPPQIYEEKCKVQDASPNGMSLGYCYSASRNLKDVNSRAKLLVANSNASISTVVNPGFVDIQAVHYINQPDPNYHNYSFFNRFLYNGKNPTYLPYTVPLVARVANNHSIKVLLEWGSQVLDLDLVVVFNVGGKLSCMVGQSYPSCAGATFGVDNYNGSEYGGETLTVDVRSYTYLFYVKRYAGGNTAARPTPTLKAEPYYSNPNSYITDSNARVSVYVNNFDHAVFNFPVPGLNEQTAGRDKIAGYPIDGTTKLVDKSKLTWMAFCMKGSVGPKSIIPLQTFWSNSDSTLQNPSPAACEDLYSKVDLPF